MSSQAYELEGKVAVITGGGGGIGKAAAARFLEEGASVVLTGRRHEVLEAARRELDPTGERVLLQARRREPAVARRVRRHARPSSGFGRVDILVNSTGIFRPVPFLEQTEEQVEEALDSILRPTFYTLAGRRPRDGRGRARRVDRQRRLDVGASTRSRPRRRARTPRRRPAATR